MRLWVEPAGGEQKSAYVERKMVTLIYTYRKQVAPHLILWAFLSKQKVVIFVRTNYNNGRESAINRALDGSIYPG
jgi:hypothetical protein